MYGIKANFSFASFEEVEQHYKDTKPIRGTDIIPMTTRSKKHMQVIKNSEDSYSLRLYSTDVMTYHRDGKFVVRTDGYITKSTTEFLDNALPHGWRATMHRHSLYLLHDNKYLWVGAHPVTVYPDGRVEGILVPQNRIVNKHGTKIMRDKVKDFMKYVKSFLVTLQFEVPEPDDSYGDELPRVYRRFLDNPENYTEDDWMPMLSYLYQHLCVTTSWAYPSKQNTFRKTGIDAYNRIWGEVRGYLTEYKLVDLPIGVVSRHH